MERQNSSAQSVIDQKRNTSTNKQSTKSSFMMPSTAKDNMNESKFGNLSQSVMLSNNPMSSLIKRQNSSQLFTQAQQKVKLSKDVREAEAFEQLPLTFAVIQKEQYHNSKTCELCAKEFSLMFRAHHCRICGKTCCNYCSLERRLSQEDQSLYFACNECDFQLTNGHAKTILNQMDDQRSQMLETVKYCVLMADAGLVDLKKSLKIKREELDQQKSDYEKRKKEQQVELKELELQTEKEKTELKEIVQKYKSLGQTAIEKQDELEILQHKIRLQKQQLEDLQFN